MLYLIWAAVAIVLVFRASIPPALYTRWRKRTADFAEDEVARFLTVYGMLVAPFWPAVTLFTLYALGETAKDLIAATGNPESVTSNCAGTFWPSSDCSRASVACLARHSRCCARMA